MARLKTLLAITLLLPFSISYGKTFLPWGQLENTEEIKQLAVKYGPTDKLFDEAEEYVTKEKELDKEIADPSKGLYSSSNPPSLLKIPLENAILVQARFKEDINDLNFDQLRSLFKYQFVNQQEYVNKHFDIFEKLPYYLVPYSLLPTISSVKDLSPSDTSELLPYRIFASSYSKELRPYGDSWNFSSPVFSIGFNVDKPEVCALYGNFQFSTEGLDDKLKSYVEKVNQEGNKFCGL